MKYIRILLIILLACGYVSCTKEEVLSYGDENYIYLEQEGKEGELPSTNFTFLFVEESVTEKIIEVPVLISGKKNSNNRGFKVEVVDTLSNSTEGVHYIIA